MCYVVGAQVKTRVFLRNARLFGLVSLLVIGCRPLKKYLGHRSHGSHFSSKAASASVQPESSGDSPRTVDPIRAFERASAQVAAGKYQDAIETCNTALDLGHLDARLLGLQALIRAQHLKDPSYDVLSDFTFAAAGEGSPHVLAEIWLNRAHFEKSNGSLESWRASLSRSLSIEPNPTVAAELGARSRCLASITKPTQGEARLVTGWLGVCRAIGKCEPADHVDEATARTRACLSHPGSAGIDISHGCQDDPPWVSTHDYSMYHWSEDFIAPAGANRYFVLSGGAGEWPAHCDPSVETQREIVGSYLRITTETVAHTIPPHQEPDGRCWDAQAEINVTFYSLASARTLLSISSLKDDGVQVTLDANSRQATLTGGACDGTIALDGRAQLRPAAQ